MAVKTERKFNKSQMIIEFTIDNEGYPSITKSKDLEECFSQLIGNSSSDMRLQAVLQAFKRAYNKYKK